MDKTLIKCIAVLSAAAIIFMSGLLGCSKDIESDETTAATEASTEAEPTLDDMSPRTYKRELTLKVETDFSKIDTSGFAEINPENSIMPDLETKKVLRDSENREYYYLKNGSTAVVFIESENEAYTAYYRENGSLKYIGDPETSWYFLSDGSLDMVSFTYTNKYDNDIITYYEPDGTRIVISAAGTFYDNELNELSNEQQLAFAKRLGDTNSDTTKETTEENK